MLPLPDRRFVVAVALTLWAISALATPPSATASELALADGRLTYVGGPEVNLVDVTLGDGRLRVTDPGARIRASDGCRTVDLHYATCDPRRVDRLVLDVGSGSDVVDVSTLGLPAELGGGPGDDALSGGYGDDVLRGDAGDDTIVGGVGNDHESGGLGDDVLDGGAGADVLRGGDGSDTVFGRDGPDVLLGEGDADSLLGGPADDTIFGGPGADTLFGDAGADTLLGGPGDDALMAADMEPDALECGDGYDTQSIDLVDRLDASCEEATIPRLVLPIRLVRARIHVTVREPVAVYVLRPAGRQPYLRARVAAHRPRTKVPLELTLKRAHGRRRKLTREVWSDRWTKIRAPVIDRSVRAVSGFCCNL